MTDGRTIGTMGLVLSVFLDKVIEKYPGINYVHDEQLTVESALTKFRARVQQDNLPATSEFPLLAFNRSELKFSPTGMGRRSVANRAFDRPTQENPELTIRRAIQATFDLRFMYVTRQAEDLEIFEVDYLGETGFSETKELAVELPDIGVFNYYVDYSPLIQKSMTADNVYHKTLIGQATIRGWFFSLQGSGKWITEIEARIKSFNDVVLGTRLIVP